MNQGNENDCGKLLFKIVNNWPDFVPSLVLYSNYAYTSNLKRTEDYETKMLRQAGISSLEMIEYDNRFVIPLSDAFERINNALITNKNPYLYICKLDLKYKMNEKLSVKDKTADLWNLLENNNENNEYKSVLVQYAVNFLLKTNQNDDAWSVFYKYVTSFYNFNSEEDFWIQFEKNLSSIDYNIVELASYFAAEQKLRDEMFRISEYCVYESSGILKENEISSKVSSSVCMNLSDAYFSTGKVAKSLDLYGRTAGKEANSKVRSEIYYRIGEIYLSLGESADALRALDYSYSINKDNVKAQFLRDKISSDRK
jgi:tetratricopeptide (TPR) repeat protein